VRFFCYNTYMLNKLQSVNKMQVKQTTIAQNNKLFYTLQKNNKLNTVRIVCAYNVLQNAKLTQRSATYVSGDLVNEQDVANTLVRISALHNNATMLAL
jgi:hypothetical protein